MTIRVKVVPKSSKDEIAGELDDGTWKIKVTAAPERGKANAAVCELIAAHFRIPKSRVTVVSGQTSHLKQVRVDL
ncbi:MAG TPA: DUF167 domain-containing protein [Bryobacteraceae bacterium]|jgi:hypothetical protein